MSAALAVLLVLCPAAAEELPGRAVAAVRPQWLKVEAWPEQVEGERKLAEAMSLLGQAPSARGFAELLTRDGGSVRLGETGSLMVIDGDNAVIAGWDFLHDKTDWQLAVFMAHELEHLLQRKLGLTGLAVRGPRELGAFLVQNRTWVELGGRMNEAHWEGNQANTQDMWAWVEHPWSSLTALALRSELSVDPERADAREYLERVLADEKAWRAREAGRMPQGKDSRAAALFVLEQATRFAESSPRGKVSAWLPGLLERAGALAPGAALPFPGEPSEKDLALLRAFPGGLDLDARGLRKPAPPPKSGA